MEFYEEYPLFNGALLDSFPLFEEPSVLENLEPGHKSVVTVKCQPSKDNYGNLVQDDGHTEQVQDINVPWMDKRIDLVDFLMNDNDTSSDINYVSLINMSNIKPVLSAQEMALLNLPLPVDDQQVLSIMDASYVDAGDDHMGTSANDASYTSTDSGVELSLDESTSSLLQLLPPQFVLNLEATSALSLLMDDDSAEAHLTNMTTDLLSMSPDDVEKVLSIPSSPVSDGDIPSLISSTIYTSSSTTTVDLADLFLNVPSPTPSISPSLSSGYSGRSSPYARIDDIDLKTVINPVVKSGSGRTVVEKKRRKMQQNKDAAIRYRQKKKTEGKTIDGECNILEDRNNDLRDQIDSMSREIAYLKELMADVATAKQSTKASKLK